MTLALLIKNVRNWRHVVFYYLSPIHKKILRMEFQNGSILLVPKDYLYEPIAETLLLNVYQLPNDLLDGVIVDVGASIGDFVLFASSKAKRARIYAFEPNFDTFRYLQANVISNQISNVYAFNIFANGYTFRSILINGYGETVIDFLKIDCEGCEYDLLLNCPDEVLSGVRRISMEIHTVQGHTKAELIKLLKRAGFQIKQIAKLHYGHYLYASRPL